MRSDMIFLMGLLSLLLFSDIVKSDQQQQQQQQQQQYDFGGNNIETSAVTSSRREQQNQQELQNKSNATNNNTSTNALLTGYFILMKANLHSTTKWTDVCIGRYKNGDSIDLDSIEDAQKQNEHQTHEQYVLQLFQSVFNNYQSNSNNNYAAGYSIVIETTVTNFTRVDFYYNNDEQDTTTTNGNTGSSIYHTSNKNVIKHCEWGSPYALGGNTQNKYNNVPYISTISSSQQHHQSTNKSFTVNAFYGTNIVSTYTYNFSIIRSKSNTKMIVPSSSTSSTQVPPTQRPAKVPTPRPSQNPTQRPSQVPTQTPTQLPTQVPTKRLTTQIPTLAPSQVPTPVLTETTFPTTTATPTPTSTQTPTPTSVATSMSTPMPMKTPTCAPSVTMPTPIPTILPLPPVKLTPTPMPMKVVHTQLPTHKPTKVETIMTTPEPTKVETIMTTQEPTILDPFESDHTIAPYVKPSTGAGETKQPTLTSMANMTIDLLAKRKWSIKNYNDTNYPMIEGRHEACFIMVNRVAVLLGGRGIRRPNIYNPITKTWTYGSYPPNNISLHHCQCVVVEGTTTTKIWIVGAWTGEYPHEHVPDDMYIYDVQSDLWETKPYSNTLPEYRRRGSAAIIAIDHLLYMAFGNRGGHETGSFADAQSVSYLDVYNTITETWTQLPDATYARDHVGGSIVGSNKDTFCIAGGRNGGIVGWPTVGPTECYNTITQTWTIEQSIPIERAGAAYGTSCNDNTLLVVGGEGNGHAYNDVHSFNGTHWIKTSSSLSTLNHQRHGTGLAIDCICNSIYIASGNGQFGGGYELTSIETISYTDEPCLA